MLFLRCVFLLLVLPLDMFAQGELTSIKKFPANMYLDSAHTPFLLGVNSGDPLQDRVIIWTHITPPDSVTTLQNVKWEIAIDSAFTAIVNSGEYVAKPKNDWTIKIDATGLQPGNTYYYRFTSTYGQRSAIGRAKTLPKDDVTHLRFAIGSCSSVFSGFFNAYARIAERNDLNAMIHLGDYIYDYVDRQEPYRVSDPYPQEPHSLEAYRERHKYYLADPDLRAARQQQTWIVIWDNHDLEELRTSEGMESRQAFFEYVPVRTTSIEEPYRIYRDFKFGNLVDLIMLDEDSYDTTCANPDQNTFLGMAQDKWLKDKLAASKGKWRILGSQRLMGGWIQKGLPTRMLHVPGDGHYFDTGCWDGYIAERNKLFDFMRESKIHNNIVVSGDIHMSFACNLVKDPLDKKEYNRKTGEGSVGVEFVPTSISRGNMDKYHLPRFITKLAEKIDYAVNPQHAYVDFIEHGYGILDVTPEACVAEFWYTKIREQTTKQQFKIGLRVRDGVDHWDWKMLAEPVR